MTFSIPTSSVLPDINVWLALSYDKHSHHPTANAWYAGLERLPRFCFCRQTQLGLFRLLSTSLVMEGSTGSSTMLGDL